MIRSDTIVAKGHIVLGCGSPCALLVDTPPNGSLFRKGCPYRVDLEANGWLVFFSELLFLNKRAGTANLVIDPLANLIDPLANLTTRSVRQVRFPPSAFPIGTET